MADPARHHSCNSSNSNLNTRNSLRGNSSNQCSPSRRDSHHNRLVLLVNPRHLVMRSSNLSPLDSPRDNSSSRSSLDTPDSRNNPSSLSQRAFNNLNILAFRPRTRLRPSRSRLCLPCHLSRKCRSPSPRVYQIGLRPRTKSRIPSKIPVPLVHLLKYHRRMAPEFRVSDCRSSPPRTKPSSSSCSNLR